LGWKIFNAAPSRERLALSDLTALNRMCSWDRDYNHSLCAANIKKGRWSCAANSSVSGLQ